MEKPEYRGRPIAKIASLAKMLGIPEIQLRKVAECSELLYRSRILKKNGKEREVFDAQRQLKSIQEKINREILKKVMYPSYLQGGLKGRDYISDCKLHVRPKVVITEDISKFFPSISRAEVFRIWKFFFCFSPEVAEVLTQLTTYRGMVPQGAKTSIFLANLVFWKEEPDLVAKFEKMGLRYSRFVDDVSVSSQRFLGVEEKTEIIDAIVEMFSRHGLRRNREKGQRQSAEKPIEIHGLLVNGPRPSLPRKKRNQYRENVRQVENIDPDNFDPDLLSKVSGQIGVLTRLHPVSGEKLKKKLRRVFDRSSETPSSEKRQE